MPSNFIHYWLLCWSLRPVVVTMPVLYWQKTRDHTVFATNSCIFNLNFEFANKKKRRKMKQFLTNELITIFLISIFTHTGAHTQTGPIIVGIPLECITPKTTWIRIVVAAAAQPSCHQQLQSASQHRAKQHLLFAKQSTIKLLIKVPRKRICR